MTKVLLAALLAVSSVAYAGTGNSKTKAKATVKASTTATRPASCDPGSCKKTKATCPPGCPPQACAPACKK